jgi:hypothetical protein
LRRAESPSKGSYRLSLRFIVLRLILNENRPENLIRQEEEEEEEDDDDNDDDDEEEEEEDEKEDVGPLHE